MLAFSLLDHNLYPSTLETSLIRYEELWFYLSRFSQISSLLPQFGDVLQYSTMCMTLFVLE